MRSRAAVVGASGVEAASTVERGAPRTSGAVASMQVASALQEEVMGIGRFRADRLRERLCGEARIVLPPIVVLGEASLMERQPWVRQRPGPLTTMATTTTAATPTPTANGSARRTNIDYLLGAAITMWPPRFIDHGSAITPF